MKYFLISLFLVIASCATPRERIVDNIGSTVNIETALGYGVGVVVDKNKNEYSVLTVAHLCDLDLEIQDMKDQFKENKEDVEKLSKSALLLGLKLYLMDVLLDSKNLCAPKIKLLGKNIVLESKVEHIDFTKDLMLIKIKVLGKGITPAEIYSKSYAAFGDRIYSTVWTQDEYIKNPIILWGNIGSYVKVVKNGKEQRVLQTQLVIGEGASGSPVFLKDGDLIGVFNLSYRSNGSLETRASMLIPAWEIRKFFKNEKFCVGTEFQCESTQLSFNDDLDVIAEKIFQMLEINEENLPSDEDYYEENP